MDFRTYDEMMTKHMDAMVKAGDKHDAIVHECAGMWNCTTPESAQWRVAVRRQSQLFDAYHGKAKALEDLGR